MYVEEEGNRGRGNVCRGNRKREREKKRENGGGEGEQVR